jgi:hypothetical protein
MTWYSQLVAVKAPHSLLALLNQYLGTLTTAVAFMECKQCPISYRSEYASVALTEIASHGRDDSIYDIKICVGLPAWCLGYLEAVACFG